MRTSFYLFVVTCIVLLDLSEAQSGAGGIGTPKARQAPLVVHHISQPRPNARSSSLPPLQLFECDVKVTLQQCKQQAMMLKTMLSKYGADQLGQWKWVLVPSQQWELLLEGHGVSPNVPALTSLAARITFFDDALVIGSAGRISQLMDVWHVGRSGLLDLVVRHELGHAFCEDESEAGADRVAQLLEERKPVTCQH